MVADPSVRKVEADVRNYDAIAPEVARADVVLHFASILGVKKVIDNARATIDTILLGTRNVLEAARQNGRIERLVNISTSEVYGNVMDATEGVPASVGTGNDARLCYASAKLMGEHLVWAYHRDFGIPTVIIRPFNIYGPRRTASNAVGVFIVKALAGSDLTLHGDGSQLRSWCYIDDFCDALVATIDAPGAAGQDFNVGNPVTAVTIYDLAQRIIRLSGSTSRLITTPYTFSDIGVRAPNSSKARELLAYNPKFDMESGLTATIQWHKDHLNDFESWF
jgi:UDP-glucose 4-epimerase